jgi:hypothetical protein
MNQANLTRLVLPLSRRMAAGAPAGVVHTGKPLFSFGVISDIHVSLLSYHHTRSHSHPHPHTLKLSHSHTPLHIPTSASPYPIIPTPSSPTPHTIILHTFIPTPHHHPPHHHPIPSTPSLHYLHTYYTTLQPFSQLPSTTKSPPPSISHLL